jgi:hypothetical protein
LSEQHKLVSIDLPVAEAVPENRPCIPFDWLAIVVPFRWICDPGRALQGFSREVADV